jgi:hypothetical protein|tara:strand:+ start:894 stop:1106 length:213 start_codon:yes stop_codon:yes gene_type:complete
MSLLWKRKFTKLVQSAFPHIDLDSESKMKKFMKKFIPLMKLKLEGKIYTNKDGSGWFDKRDLNKTKEKTL